MSTHSNQNIDENNYTPEALAWKLLMDDNITSSSLMIFSDENNKEVVFEILITIYLEMVFGHYKMQYLESLDEESLNDYDNIYDNFKLNIENVNLFSLTNIFLSKFNKLKYILNVREITYEEYEKSRKKRYCTVFLKDNPSDYTYFMMNKQYLDKDKRYHFVLNSLYKSENNNNLYDVFCTVNINNTYFKIYFTNLV